MSNNIFEYVKVINQKSKKAFDKISRSSSKDRNLAILNTSLIIKQKQEEIIRLDHAGEIGPIKIYEGQLIAMHTI